MQHHDNVVNALTYGVTLLLILSLRLYVDTFASRVVISDYKCSNITLKNYKEPRLTAVVGESLDDSTDLTSGQEPICIEFSGIFKKGLVKPHLSSANSLKRNKFQTPASCKG